MVDIDSILSDFQKTIGSHAKSVLNSFSALSPENEDDVASVVRDLELKCDEIASFYSNFDNAFSFNKVTRISQNFLSSCMKENQEHNVSVTEYEVNVENENLAYRAVEDDAAIKRAQIETLLNECYENLKDIRQSSLKRLQQNNRRAGRHLIPFGKMRAWANDVMKTKNASKAPTYATAAKCARLRRRLVRLFHMARAAHAFTQHVGTINHPEIARLQQELMRIRLQSTLRLKTDLSNSDNEFRVESFSQDPEMVSRRFGRLDEAIAPALNNQKIHIRLDDLAASMSDLLMLLSTETKGCSELIDAEEPWTKDQLHTLVLRSLESFCNFYFTSVAAADESENRHAAFLSQLDRSDEELDDISASDAECMMDAFDVFDAFLEQKALSSEPVGLDLSAASSEPASPSPRSVQMDVDDSQAEDEECHLNAPSESQDASATQPFLSVLEEIPLPYETNSSQLASEPNFGIVVEDAPEVGADYEEEDGEIVDDHQSLEDGNPALSDIDQTEQDIMEEWAPLTEKKPLEKLSMAATVQKYLDDATKLCSRELSTMMALGASAQPTPAATASGSGVDSGSRSVATNPKKRKNCPPKEPRYSREFLLKIRDKIQASLLRQKESKQAYRKFFQTK